MPNCKKCQNWFPTRCLIDGKEKYLHTRSYCLECSPIGSKQGYELRKENTKATTKRRVGYPCICKICNRIFKATKNIICSTCRSRYQRYKNRNKGIEYLGGQCAICKINDYDVLTFHHRNQEDKIFNLSANWGVAKWAKLQEELEKCDLLCNNCHQKLHRNERNANLQKILDYYQNCTKNK